MNLCTRIGNRRRRARLPVAVAAIALLPPLAACSSSSTVEYATDAYPSVSLVDLGSRAVAATWRIPGGGSPDMGGVSADGRVLWLSGRYNGVVYAFDTATGNVIARVPVGAGPHGLCVYPQPGRYSLGHTGVFR